MYYYLSIMLMLASIIKLTLVSFTNMLVSLCNSKSKSQDDPDLRGSTTVTLSTQGWMNEGAGHPRGWGH